MYLISIGTARMSNPDGLDIPEFLKISPERRKQAWDERRVAVKPLPTETAPVYRRIPSIPGAAPDDDGNT